MALLDDLKALRLKLRTVSAQLDDDGDIVSSRRVDSAILSVEDAIRIEQAKQILATLPDDADVKKATTMLASMNAAAASINADQAAVTRTVQIATGFAHIVTDLAMGQFLAAAQAAASVSSVL